MWKSEWDFWTSEQAEITLDEHIKEVLLMFARKNIPPIKRQLDLVDYEMEIVPGIRAVEAEGHTRARAVEPNSLPTYACEKRVDGVRILDYFIHVETVPTCGH